MKKIEILGMGCANCNKLYQNALAAVKMSGKEAQVTKIEDIKKIAAYGVMSTPALVVDGQVKLTGKVPSVEQLKELLS